MSAPPALRIRDIGYAPGLLPSGPTNSLLDVPGVHIAQLTVPTAPNLKAGSTATKGCTVVLPRPPNDIHVPCHAGTFTLNGNGELTGSRQMKDWGYTNTPIVFTNSLSLGTCFDGCWDYVMGLQDKASWDEMTKSRNYGTPVIGETADWMINSDVRSSRLSPSDIAKTFGDVKSKDEGAIIEEGQHGGGAGMTCHQFAGGTGTASRVLGRTEDGKGKEYTLGVLCQTNYGTLIDLQVGGIPVGKILKKEKELQTGTAVAESRFDRREEGVDVHAPTGKTKDGSCLILIITDAPLLPHQLDRLARHATAGMAQVGTHGVGRTFSGDIFLALSTAEHPAEQLSTGTKLRHINPTETYQVEVVKNESIDPYFYACSEAVEEAVLNSIVGGRTGTVAMDGTKIDGFPVEKVRDLLKKHLVQV